MSQNDEFDPTNAAWDESHGSYWTKRRKIVQRVNKILEETAVDVEPNDALGQFSSFCAGTVNNTADPDVRSTGSVCTSDSDLTVYACASENTAESPKYCGTFSDLQYFDESDVSDAASLSSDASEECDLPDKLSDWALSFNIPKEAVTALLHLLHGYHPDLPLDARTLLKTPDASNHEVKMITEGFYYHFGVANGLEKLSDSGLVKLSTTDATQTLQLQINVDGLPLYKSTNYQLWPILAMLVNVHTKVPFVVGIFGGHRKPGNVFEFLHDFVEECHTLEDKGLSLGCHVYAFKIHSILCDAPARAFVRNTKGHTAYYGCDRCTQSGKWLNKITYPEVAAPKRTDGDFRSKVNEEHHIGDCPLAGLSIDLVSQLPLDYMHLVCLGVVRRLMLAWLKGPLNCRLRAKAVCDISHRLADFRLYMPTEFSRRPRSLSDIDRFKATEFRQILLYTGVVAFRGILPDELYNHFMLLSCAIYCCLSPRLCYRYCEYAKKLLISFVEYAGKVFGCDFLVYNVHSLIHITDDVHNFGPLDDISCFPYENYLRRIKKLVRSSFLPFQQVIGRLTEMQQLKFSKITKPTPLCSSEHWNGPVVDGHNDCQQFKTVVTKDFRLSLSAKDSCVITENRSVGVVKNILMNGHEILLVLKLYGEVDSLYTYPLSSRHLDVFAVKTLQNLLTVVPLCQICCKCVRLPLDSSSFAVIPLLHHSE